MEQGNRQKQASGNIPKFSQLKKLPITEREDLSVFDIEKDFQPLEIKSFKNKKCGNVNDFQKYLEVYQKTKSNFKVISYGSTKKIVYGNNKFLFSGIKGEKKPKGLHLIGFVKKDIDNLIQKGFEIPKIPEKKPNLTYIHHKNLQWFGSGMEAVAIDINHCYWRTAFLLGYITKRTYNKGLEKNEFKEGRNIAIGTLGKMLSVTRYEAGMKVADYIDDRDYLKYGGFFWQVLEKIYALLMDLQDTLKEDFLMFLTDCVIVAPEKRDLAVEVMEKHGYSTKEYKLAFTYIDEEKVNWITEKGEKKQIIHPKLAQNSSQQRRFRVS